MMEASKRLSRLSLILVFSVAGFCFLNTPFALAGDFNFTNIFSGANLFSNLTNLTNSKNFGLIKGFIENSNGNVNIPRLEPSPLRISPAKPSPIPVPVPRPEPASLNEIVLPSPSPTPTPTPEPTPIIKIKQTIIKEIISPPSQPIINTLGLIFSLESKLNQAVSSLESRIQNLQVTAPTILQLPSTNTRGIGDSSVTNSTKLQSETLTLTNDGTIDGSLTVKKSITIGTSTIFIDGDNNKLGIGDSSPETNFEVVGTASISGATTLGGALTLSGHTSLTTASISGNFQTAGRFILGDNGDTGEINTSDWDISSTGALTGIGAISADGAYTQTGTGANTFSGATTFSSTGNALLVSAGRAEFQGTASASYLLTGNTLQVGGFASAAYSRFGTNTTTYSNDITTTNDLLISGALEVDGNSFLDGKASISGNFQTAGRFILGDNGDTGEINTSDWDISSTGALTGIGAITADGAYTQTGTGANTFSGATTFSSTGNALLVSAGRSEFQGTASASYLLTGNTLQVGGFASAAYSRFGTNTTTYSNDITTTNDLLISGALEVDGNSFLDGKASISGNFQTAGRFILGDNGDTGEINTSDWDISNTGALTGIGAISADGAYTQTGTGANTFSGATTFSSTGTALLVSAGRAEFQGTASASYLLTGNTLQVGGFASAAYSRFGTATATDSSVDTTNDLLISGSLEVDSVFRVDGTGSHTLAGEWNFDSNTLGIDSGTNRVGISTSPTSLDTTLEVGGTASISGATTLRGVTYTWPSADGANARFLQTNGSGTLSWAQSVTSNSLDFDEIVNSPTLDANLNIQRAGYYIGIGAAPQTVFEVQGTASASYFLTGNTLQVGGFASAAYSRFGTATTGYSADIDTTNDLLISGALEVDGNSFLDGKASISGNFQTAGRFVLGDNGDTGEINTSDWDISSTGALTGIGAITADGAYTQTGTGANTFSGATTFSSTGNALLVSAGRSEFQGTASASYLLTGNTLQVGGFASAAYSRFGTATATDAAINTTNDLLISGALEVDDILRVDGTGTHTIAGLLSINNASVSGNFELTGNTRLGINPGGETTTSLEVGGTASISGATTLRGVTYTWPSADGANQRFLQTNGSGTLSWAQSVTSNSLDFDEIVNSPTLDANLNIQRAGYYIGIGAAPQTVFEVQGTASASYFLTGNTLQVGGFASAAYSRFGTATTGYSADIDTTNDLLISGALEVDGNVFLDGKASISGNFQTAGRFILGDNGDTGEINTSDWDISNTGALTGIGAITADGAYTQTGTGANTFSGATTFSSTGTALLVSAGRAEFQGTASASYLLTGNTLQVGGFSSAAYSRFGTATATDSSVDTTNDLLISGSLEVDSVFRVDGTSSHTLAGEWNFDSNTLGIDSGTNRVGISTSPTSLDTTLEVGGTASISGATTLRGVTYTWPSADGSSGQQLQTNGTGALSWAAAGGVSSNSIDFDEIISTMLLDANLTINRGGYYIGLGAAPSTVFEVQGTASASYFLTGNTIQVGGFASVAYNRFGTTATTHSNYISTSNDILVSGDLEGRGSISFAGTASLSNTLWVSPGGSSGNVGIGTTTTNYGVYAAGTRVLTIEGTGGASTIGAVELSNAGADASGNVLGDFSFIAQKNSATYQRVGFIRATTEGATANQRGANMAFFTQANGGAGASERMRIDSAGNVGIGTTGPTSKLQISGGNCADDAGGGGCTADFAEIYPSSEDVEKGDVVMIDALASVSYSTRKSDGQGTIIGVVSTAPAAIADNGNLRLMANDYVLNPRNPAIALSGRTPVKVTDENGLIKVGDRLTVSKTKPGYAMKQTQAGQSIGIALENGNSDKVLVFVNLSYWMPTVNDLSFLTSFSSSSFTLSSSSSSTLSLNTFFSSILNQFKQLGIIFESGIVRAREFIADKITAKLIRTNNFEIEDSATGELYCVRITNGDWDKKKGECSSQNNPEPALQGSTLNETLNNLDLNEPTESTEVEPSAEVESLTPEPSVEPTPAVLAPEEQEPTSTPTPSETPTSEPNPAPSPTSEPTITPPETIEQ